MMIIVSGPRGGNVHPDLKDLVVDATYFFAKQLKIDRLSLELNVRMYHSSMIDSEAEGYCLARSTRVFDIDVCVYTNLLKTLAHEMVHVRQWARKELSLDRTFWKKRKYGSDYDYWTSPWEVEARKLQDTLVKAYETC